MGMRDVIRKIKFLEKTLIVENQGFREKDLFVILHVFLSEVTILSIVGN